MGRRRGSWEILSRSVKYVVKWIKNKNINKTEIDLSKSLHSDYDQYCTYPPIQHIQTYNQLSLPLTSLLPQPGIFFLPKDGVRGDGIYGYPFWVIYVMFLLAGGRIRGSGGEGWDGDGAESSGGLECGEGGGSEWDMFVVVPFYSQYHIALHHSVQEQRKRCVRVMQRISMQ